ncbi:MAG: methylmalonyl Co-A mutase-associated GTPase MeaB [Planctomycetota bacterium]|nr:methylmalonyl Co-A mutase-associated GTPase MeaB [Planctomycetota bacterium]
MSPGPVRRKVLSDDDYVQGVLSGDRSLLARAITLVESNAPRHRDQAHRVLTALLPNTGKSLRVGITGVPGVGKSTFIESLGRHLTSQQLRIAVLAVDPTSSVRGGSILGDKTRMSKLAVDPLAFIRPSPSQGSLGGVHRKTRETLLLCEAAGFDVVLVETVGVGQSETLVSGMVDTYLVLMLAGAGDDLQGIKKGILEVADLLTINKADGDNVLKADRARSELEGALRIMRPREGSWTPPVLTCSALENSGVADVWERVLAHRKCLESDQIFLRKRQEQQLKWLESLIQEELMARFRHHPAVKSRRGLLEQAVKDGQMTATQAAETLLEAFSDE